jgi:hypothetical protein
MVCVSTASATGSKTVRRIVRPDSIASRIAEPSASSPSTGCTSPQLASTPRRPPSAAASTSARLTSKVSATVSTRTSATADDEAVLLQAPGHDGERLEVVAAPAQLALVDRREARRDDRDEPEDAAEDEQLLERGAEARGVGFERPQQLALLAVVDDEQQERVPHRELHAGPVGGQQRDGDEVDDDEVPHGAAGPAGDVGRPREEDAVEHEDGAEEPRRAVAGDAPRARDDDGDEQVGGDDPGQERGRGPEDVAGEDRGDGDDHDQHVAERLHVAQALGDRDQLAGGDRRMDGGGGAHGLTGGGRPGPSAA